MIKTLFTTLLLLAAMLPTPAALAATQPVANKKAAGDSWTINIQNAGIKAFVRQVADMTGKNFVLDPRVRAKNITVISRKALTSKEVYQLFLAVLQVNGYAAVASGDVTKIVPSTTAKSYDLPMSNGQSGGQGLVTEVLPLHGVTATEMVPVLRPLVPQYGHLAAVASANSLVISDHEDNIRRLDAIVSRLEGHGSGSFAVVHLKHAWVGSIVKTLGGLIPQISTGKNQRSHNTTATVVADERTNSLLVRGDATLQARIRRLVARLDVPGSKHGNVKVVRLEHGDAKEIATLLGKFFDNSQKGSKNSNPDSSISIQPDESLNALVVRADAGKMAEVNSIIKQLDVRRAQVLIEAAIIEVSADKARNLGVQWLAGDVDSGVGGTNFSNAGLSVNNILQAILGSSSGATSAPNLADGITAGFGDVGNDGRVRWAGLVQALATSSAVNLLSTPSVLTLDNQKASIIVGQNVPFVTGRYTDTNNSVSNPFQTIQRQDVGITLKVTPHLGAGNSMRLKLAQEVSSVVQNSATANGITTNKRKIKTTVLARSGQTIVLGGLIQDDIKTSVSKVPLLGDIPFLGALFRSTHKSHERSNLIIFLRPTIVHNAQGLVDVTHKKYMGLVSMQFTLGADGKLERLQKHPLPLELKQVFDGRTPPSKALQKAVKQQRQHAESAAPKGTASRQGQKASSGQRQPPKSQQDQRSDANVSVATPVITPQPAPAPQAPSQASTPAAAQPTTQTPAVAAPTTAAHKTSRPATPIVVAPLPTSDVKPADSKRHAAVTASDAASHSAASNRSQHVTKELPKAGFVGLNFAD